MIDRRREIAAEVRNLLAGLGRREVDLWTAADDLTDALEAGDEARTRDLFRRVLDLVAEVEGYEGDVLMQLVGVMRPESQP